MTLEADTPPFINNTYPTSNTQAIREKNKRPPRAVYSWCDGPYNSVRGESALWAAVITQAMMDALSRSRNPEQLYHKQAATQWLTGNSKDFFLVCLMAGMDPHYVRRKAKKALVSPISWRASPGQGKRYLERKSYRQRIKKEIEQPAPPADNAVVIIGPWR